MQIYLQKYKRRKSLAHFATALLALGALMCIAFGFIYKHFGAEAVLETASAMPPSVFRDEAYIPRDDDMEALDKDEKMNNLVQNNAKTKVSDGKTLQSGLKEKTIAVKLPDKSVVTMPLEEYVTGCVFGEMPLSFEPQAIMAQCVASRTFAVRCALGYSKHADADVCTSPACCQNFISPEEKNVSENNIKKLTDAVNSTRGIIATFEGEPIVAVYHASSGSTTLDSEEVWGGRVEYLRAVDSPKGEEALAVAVKGHRVGMSQHGANLLAKEGKSYADILKYYYSGISLGFI